MLDPTNKDVQTAISTFYESRQPQHKVSEARAQKAEHIIDNQVDLFTQSAWRIQEKTSDKVNRVTRKAKSINEANPDGRIQNPSGAKITYESLVTLEIAGDLKDSMTEALQDPNLSRSRKDELRALIKDLDTDREVQDLAFGTVAALELLSKKYDQENPDWPDNLVSLSEAYGEMPKLPDREDRQISMLIIPYALETSKRVRPLNQLNEQGQQLKADTQKQPESGGIRGRLMQAIRGRES